MTPQSVEFLSWIAGIFGALLATFALVDQLGIRLRRRHSAEFWQQEIAASMNERDRRTLLALHRQDLSKIVATTWIPARRAYAPVAGTCAGLWATWDFSYRLGAINPKNLGWTDLLDPLGGPTFLAIPLVMLPLGFISVLTIIAQRTCVRRDFLAGLEVDPPPHQRGSTAVLVEVAGGRGVAAPFAMSMGAWLLVSAIAYLRGFRDAGFNMTETPTLPFILVLPASALLLLGIGWIADVVTTDEVHLEDLYPPHGDYSKVPAYIVKARERRGHQPRKPPKQRQAPWEHE